jgi:hypothetical protein
MTGTQIEHVWYAFFVAIVIVVAIIAERNR